VRYADTEAVTNAWLTTLPGITAAMVGQTLPADNSTWAASGFITPAGSGGTPDLYFAVAHPVVTLSCWAANPNTGLPPWDKARQLAEIVRYGCLNNGTGALVTLPYADQNARVLSAYLKQEPRRMYGDIGDYACYVVDIVIHWSAHE
jgi:hypothetical protein